MRRSEQVSEAQSLSPLPPQVLNLARCEREVAVVIYLEGGMTAKLLEARLPRKISNSALRAMLQRLCRKGILRRHKVDGSHSTTDRRIPYLYTPAITPDVVRTRALQQVARDYFDGSLLRLAEEAVRALQQVSGRTSGAPGLHIAA